MNTKIKNIIISYNKLLGVSTEFYLGSDDIAGYAEGGSIYLNENSDYNLIMINEHEILHFYESTETFKAAKEKILSAFTLEELKKKQVEYLVKYYNLYSGKEIEDGILDTEIAIDAMVGNGKFSNKVLSVAADEVTKIFNENITKLENRRYLNLTLSNRIEQGFSQLSQWEKLFALNYYDGIKNQIPNNKDTKYEQVRQNIEGNLQKLYAFAENEDNFKIDTNDNEFLEREFISEIKALRARGEGQQADYIEQNKQNALEEMAKKISLTLHAEYKHNCDYIKSTSYEPAFKYLMLNETLTKTYKKEKQNDEEKTICEKRILNKTLIGHMVFNREVLSTIYNNLTEYLNFANLYFAGIAISNKTIARKNSVKLDGVDTFGKGQWKLFKGKTSDSKNYIKNAQELSSLVQNTPWCTKTLASSQLEYGDFYVFVDNEKKPHIAVKLNGNSIDEVRGVQGGNAQELEDEYRDIAIEFLTKNKDIQNGMKWLKKEEWNNRLVKYNSKIADGTLKQEEIGNLISDYFDKNSDYRSHGGYENSNRQNLKNKFVKIIPKIAKYYNIAENEICIGNYQENNKEFSFKLILGDSEFRHSNVKNLDSLQIICGFANFKDSNVVDLGSLQSIGGNANFEYSLITDLGLLQTIGGNANFENSLITNLGSLQSIGGNAHFGRPCIIMKYMGHSSITNLGSLQSIGGNAIFSGSKINNLGSLQSIGRDANFADSQITSLRNLKSIGQDAYFQNSKLADLGSLQTIGGDAIFSDSQVINLGSLQIISGIAHFNELIKDFGKLKFIGADIEIPKENKELQVKFNREFVKDKDGGYTRKPEYLKEKKAEIER